MNVHIRTYGCQMNERDSEAVGARLEAAGHRLVEEDEADVVLVNTCSVRAKAEDKALGKLRLLVAGNRDRPGRTIGAMGCMVERLGPRILEEVRGLDFALGPRRLGALETVLAAVREGRGPVVDTGPRPEGGGPPAEHLAGGVTAFVTVMEGCSRGCAYCVVPRVRGAEWSRPAAAVLAEVRSLAAAGVLEVTLLGQSVTSYGRTNPVDPFPRASALGVAGPFPRLVEAVADIPGIARVRFTSGHPSGCTDDLVRVLAAKPAVCHHLHLPLQSGSDRILERMGRGYTTDGYRAAVARLRAAAPDLALTTDVIVGFPGESESDFERTRAFLEETGFDNAFVFKYSPRSGTAAAGWDDDVPMPEKRRRNQVLLEDQDRRSQRLHDALVGREMDVLIEGPSLRNRARWAGRTGTNKTVIVELPPEVEGAGLVRVRIDRARPQTLYGTFLCRLGPAVRMAPCAPVASGRELTTDGTDSTDT